MFKGWGPQKVETVLGIVVCGTRRQRSTRLPVLSYRRIGDIVTQLRARIYVLAQLYRPNVVPLHIEGIYVWGASVRGRGYMRVHRVGIFAERVGCSKG